MAIKRTNLRQFDVTFFVPIFTVASPEKVTRSTPAEEQVPVSTPVEEREKTLVVPESLLFCFN